MHFCVIFLFLNFGVLAQRQEKRIVLHSDTDVQTEIAMLRNEVASLKIALNTELSSLKSELSSRGSTYVRWGKESCNTNGTTLIYKGYMAGKDYTSHGSGSNSLCLPGDPTWGKYGDASNSSWRGYIYGAEFEVINNIIFGKHVTDEDIPCAVCKVPGTSVMIPARVNCYPGWKVEYTGYLMSAYHDHFSTNYVCVDGDPDFVYRGAGDTNGHLLYLVKGRCGTLPCPPYHNYRELACVVCSM